MLQHICLLVLLLFEQALASNMRVFNFESGPDTKLVIPVDSNKTLNLGFTICFRSKLKNWSDTRIFDSEKNLELVFYHYKCGAGGAFTFGAISKLFNPLYDIKKFNTWQPFCVTYDAQGYNLRLYIDGEKILEPQNVKDEFGNPFDFGNSIIFESSKMYELSGSLADLNIWSRPLNDTEIAQFSFSRDDNVTAVLKPDLLDWSNQFSYQIGKNVSTSYIQRRDLHLPGSTAKFHIFDDIDGPQTSGRHLCGTIGAGLPSPKTKADYNSTFPEKMQVPDFCLGQFWSGFFRSKSSSSSWVFLDENGTETRVDYLPWDQGHPSGEPGEECGFFGTNLKCQTTQCDYEFCIGCFFQQQVLFTLRGFNEKDKVDESLFRMVMESSSSSSLEFIFQGMGGSYNIVYNLTSRVWELRKADSGSMLGYLDGIDVKFPVGLHDWKINNAKINRPLKLTKCKRNEFGCNSGECVALEKRCNMVEECDDGSDERICLIVELDPNRYNKDDPPIILGNKTVVEISTDLFLVGGFEEIAMTFKAGFVLKVRWFDYRLKFINLRETNNFIEGGQDDVIWIPMLSFATSVTSLYLQNDPFSTIAIEKKGNGTKPPLSHLNNEEIYSGRENPITFSRYYETTNNCEFQLERYPFDSQTCSIKLSVHYNLRNYTTLKPGKLKNYIITEKLTQFIIVNKTIEVSEDGHDFNLKIMLTRIIINHLTNTYLPTLTLLVIVEITLFFEESQLQVAIGFSLTILLVMYTLYQGVIQSLPKTAYLKFIDVWLLFCLIIPITVFMVEVFWELHRVKKSAQEKKMKTLRPIRMSRKTSLDLDQSQIPFQRLAQIGFIFVTVAFIMSYCLIAANYLNNPITA